MSIEVPFVVEGDTDVPFARKLILLAGGLPGTPYVQRGKHNLLQRIHGYANGARHQPWLVLLDLDDDDDCVPSVRQRWEPQPPHRLALRIVVRAIEAWALGDRAAASEFLRVSPSKIPRRPEDLADPKGSLIELARRSRKQEIVRALGPRPGSGRRQGPEYEARLIEFGELHWNIEGARESCPSLDRAVTRLVRLLQESTR